MRRWLEDMNSMFPWQKQCCSCHSNIKFTSSRHRVISSLYMFEVFGLVSNPSDQVVSVISFLRLQLKEPLNSALEVKLCIVLLYHVTFHIL